MSDVIRLDEEALTAILSLAFQWGAHWQRENSLAPERLHVAAEEYARKKASKLNGQ